MEATGMEATAITVLVMGDTTLATMATLAMAILAMAMDILATAMAIVAMGMVTHQDSSMGDLSLTVVSATMGRQNCRPSIWDEQVCLTMDNSEI